MLLGLRTAIYRADDIVRAKAWYTQVVGKAPYFDQPFYVGFNVGGFELGLDPNGKPGGAGGRRVLGCGRRGCGRCPSIGPGRDASSAGAGRR